MIFCEAVFGIVDIGLLENGVAVYSDEEGRDMLLESQFRGVFARHDRAARFDAVRRVR